MVYTHPGIPTYNFKYSLVYLLNKYIVHLMNSKVGLLQIDERR